MIHTVVDFSLTPVSPTRVREKSGNFVKGGEAKQSHHIYMLCCFPTLQDRTACADHDQFHGNLGFGRFHALFYNHG